MVNSLPLAIGCCLLWYFNSFYLLSFTACMQVKSVHAEGMPAQWVTGADIWEKIVAIK